MSHCVLPGGTLGVLGSGQLGRMFAIAARNEADVVKLHSFFDYVDCTGAVNRQLTLSRVHRIKHNCIRNQTLIWFVFN